MKKPMIKKILAPLLISLMILGIFPFAPPSAYAANSMPAGFSASPTSVDFGSAAVVGGSYTLPPAQTISVQIDDSDPASSSAYNLDAVLSGTASAAFTLTKGAWPHNGMLDPGPPAASVSVVPKAGLAPGVYSAAVRFTGNSENIPGAGTPYTWDVPITFTVNGQPPAITGPNALPAAWISEPYSAQITADGTTPMTFSAENNWLPAGLTINPNTGLISGTPTAEYTAPTRQTHE